MEPHLPALAPAPPRRVGFAAPPVKPDKVVSSSAAPFWAPARDSTFPVESSTGCTRDTLHGEPRTGVARPTPSRPPQRVADRALKTGTTRATLVVASAAERSSKGQGQGSRTHRSGDDTRPRASQPCICDAQLPQTRLTSKEEQMHALIRSLLIVMAAQRAGVDGQSTSTCASVSVHSVFHLNRSRSSRSRPSPSLTQRTALLSRWHVPGSGGGADVAPPL
jgi:hypothetical protein